MGIQDSPGKSAKSLIGVWRVKEIARHGGSGSTADEPFPNLVIFTRNYYSMIWIFGPEPKRPFANRWNPTHAEKIQRFDSLVVNSGTYEIEGSKLIAHPLVARIPDFMGGKLICEYHVENEKMTLRFIDEYSFDGVQAPWVASGGLVLTLVRLDQ
jgi:hypothetical protein